MSSNIEKKLWPRSSGSKLNQVLTEIEIFSKFVDQKCEKNVHSESFLKLNQKFI